MQFEKLCQHPRVRVRKAGEPNPQGRAVVYWMQRAQRAADNPALDIAVHAANALGKPLVVLLTLVPFYPGANLRHYAFMSAGLGELAEDLEKLGIGFVLRRYPDHSVPAFVREVGAALLVGDENPLRQPDRWRNDVAAAVNVPFWTVDADVVVPSSLLGKEQYAARTMRPRLHRLLPTYLVAERAPKPKLAWRRPRGLAGIDPSGDVLSGLAIDRRVAPVAAWRGGRKAALARLHHFLRNGLRGYDGERNRPERDGTSCLSPYLHFGQLGPREVALAIQAAAAPEVDKAAFLEQLLVRRELAINFMRYNPAYDRLDGCEAWARRTLVKHAHDRRPLLLRREALAAGETPDPLWNAAQRQMTEGGWMHSYLRMYWAKRLLEWCPTAADAFDTAVWLNDRFELDGRDPNGYTGIAWAIGGKHDRAWGPERPIFGTVRYMSYASTSRKFHMREYLAAVTATGLGPPCPLSTAHPPPFAL
ncbi:MAG TPA: deoxyribodipyrimidine photo-lyase [Polyangia bacterium]|jgi:Deoxyribodipyrimidine photolyase|nr:deoxyribodipyrimidine photo-lyase [Polyangia bacterium]